MLSRHDVVSHDRASRAPSLRLAHASQRFEEASRHVGMLGGHWGSMREWLGKLRCPRAQGLLGTRSTEYDARAFCVFLHLVLGLSHVVEQLCAQDAQLLALARGGVRPRGIGRHCGNQLVCLLSPHSFRRSRTALQGQHVHVPPGGAGCSAFGDRCLAQRRHSLQTSRC